MEGRWEGYGKWESRADCGWNLLEIRSYWGQCPVLCVFGTMYERCCSLTSCSGPFVPINHNSSTRMSRHGTRASCLEMKAGERLYLSFFVLLMKMTARARAWRYFSLTSLRFATLASYSRICLGASLQNHLHIAAVIIGWCIKQIWILVNTVAVCKSAIFRFCFSTQWNNKTTRCLL